MSSPTQVRLPDRPDTLPQSAYSFEGSTSNPALSEASIDEGLGFLSQGGILSAMAKVVMESVAANGLCVAYAKQGSVFCRASCGDIAPAVGTPLNLKSGIGAQCLREGKTVTCADTETDPRVNREVCRRIGVRSILAVPLRVNSAVIGITQAFYAEPSGFSEANVLELEQSARLFVSILPADVSVDTGQRPSAKISPVTAEPATKVATTPLRETKTAASKSEGQIIEAMSAVVAAPAFAPEVSDQKLPSQSQQISHAARSSTLPMAKPVLVPRAPERASRQDVAATIRSIPSPAAARLTHKTAFESLAENQQPVWWKRPIVAAVALSTVLALLWVITHTSSHPLVPFKQPDTSSLEKQEVETASLPFAQLQNKARAGDPKAQIALAKRFETGKGVDRNLTKAYWWYIVAAESGNDSARQAIRPLTSKLTAAQIAGVRFEIARMYANGIGVRRRDPVAAYAWMVLAEAAGDRRAKAEQNRLAASMRPQEIAEAQTRASYWLKSRADSTQ